jgi:hypothetical protein
MMMITLSAAEDVAAISNMHFKTDDVLATPIQRIRRRAGLLKAVALESISREEVILTLEDLNSVRRVRSRIIATGDEQVLLEKGIVIPVRSICRIEFSS